jgi:hypothetical protein
VVLLGPAHRVALQRCGFRDAARESSCGHRVACTRAALARRGARRRGA